MVQIFPSGFMKTSTQSERIFFVSVFGPPANRDRLRFQSRVSARLRRGKHAVFAVAVKNILILARTSWSRPFSNAKPAAHFRSRPASPSRRDRCSKPSPGRRNNPDSGPCFFSVPFALGASIVSIFGASRRQHLSSDEQLSCPPASPSGRASSSTRAELHRSRVLSINQVVGLHLHRQALRIVALQVQIPPRAPDGSGASADRMTPRPLTPRRRRIRTDVLIGLRCAGFAVEIDPRRLDDSQLMLWIAFRRERRV